MQTGARVVPHTGVMPGRHFVCAQGKGVIEKGFELDFSVAQNIRIGRASGLVLAQKFGEHAVFVICREIDVFDLYADDISHCSGVYEVLVRRAVFVVVIVFPVFHEDANHFMALALQHQGGHGRVDTATQPHHNPLLFQLAKAAMPVMALPKIRA